MPPVFPRRLRPCVAACVLGPLLIASTVVGAVASYAESPGESLPIWAGSWEPPNPNPEGWDWVRISSNEWVKGEILLMRDFGLQFDSDEFGVINLDWEDVSEVRAERIYSVVSIDLETVYTGTMVVRGEEILVRTPSGIERMPRTELLAIVPDTSTELNLWSIRAGAGISLRSGNTESSDLNGDFRITREDRNTTTLIKYSGIYGSLNKEKNTNTHRGSFVYEYQLSRDVFVAPAGLEVYSDEFQNVAYRLTPTVGAGYYLLRRPKIEWNARGAAGYQFTRSDSAPAGKSKDSENGAIVVATTIDVDLPSDIDLIINYQLQVIAPDFDLTNHHGDVAFEIELTSVIDLDVKFIWDRIENPNENADGSRPDTDDFRTTIGLAIEY